VRRWVGLLFVVALSIAGCDRGSSSAHVAPATTTRTTVAVCAQKGDAVPNAPPDVTRWADGAPVIGSGALWTIASASSAPAVHELGVWRVKFPWFTRPAGDDVPTIHGRRLYGPGTFRAETNRAFDARGSWVASNLTFSAPGCWEVTARYRGSTLTFPLRVGAAD
jgi:hypothetical protein